ncbi:hypothetical protein CDD81_5248 [Ophiocordyceps australis]|uniref:DUF676 domain-containing protein n=1 Tax=Ophiocordyceps australis TaxID=1399860 RepID=A0A2C5YGR3_9HYPO|nr:hypothetical protein CDD81_5248 [Ophiocordyceps australis]
MSDKEESSADYVGGNPKADHLCVLVHGLWGDPKHMKNIAKALRLEYSPDELYMLLAKSNSGSFTYDGIELGGERVCAEIEQEMRSIESCGGKVRKLSIVGYSLGGLVSRYAIGLLYAKGILDTVECMNFTTFASPHLGVRSPLKGWYNTIWNYLGARTLSMSGTQLFTIDSFRDTGRPLLAVLADPSSIFMHGLRKFQRRSLYANIVNDRSAAYYTTMIDKTDAYHRSLDKIEVNYLKGSEPVILDPQTPISRRRSGAVNSLPSSASSTVMRWIKRVPYMMILAILVPVGTAIFLVNSVREEFHSSGRRKLHEAGRASINIEEYRVPLLIKELRGEAESAYEALNSSLGQQHLSTDDEEPSESDLTIDERSVLRRERRLSTPTQPTLAMAPCQFEMAQSLNALGWRKYPVWIHKNRHSHAAIIVRMDKETFDEGHVVLRHFAQGEFLV